MAVLRITLQVLALCAMACCFPIYQVADLDQAFGKAIDQVLSPLETKKSDNALNFVKQIQDIHAEGSKTIATAMYDGLTGVIQNMLKLVSDKVAEAKSIHIENKPTSS